MSTEHAKHHFSITFQTSDLAVVGCLRALAKFCQKTGNNQIPWGGTKDKDWRNAENHITFRFTTPDYRDGLASEAQRLLQRELWSVVDKSDTDPASPQSR